MAPITLRRAVDADADAIGRTFDSAVRDQWSYLGELAQAPMFDAAEWRNEIASHAAPNALIVAEDERGEVVGFTAVHPDDGEMYLLFVAPEHTCRGIGHRLLDAAHDALRMHGCSEAFLYTHGDNRRAQAVYAAAGYYPDGSVRESEFRGIAIREVRLVKQL